MENEYLKSNSYLTGIFVSWLETWMGFDKIIKSFPELIKKGMKTFHFAEGVDKQNNYRALVEKKNFQMKLVFHNR